MQTRAYWTIRGNRYGRWGKIEWAIAPALLFGIGADPNYFGSSYFFLHLGPFSVSWWRSRPARRRTGPVVPAIPLKTFDALLREVFCETDAATPTDSEAP